MSKENRAWSKQEAAAHQIEAAIEAFRRGDYVSTITLCGAAESCVPPTDKQHWFDETKQMLSKVGGGSPPENKLVTMMNKERDWLKHNDKGHAQTIEISQETANIWITRALTKYVAVYDSHNLQSLSREEWGRRPHNYDELLAGWGRFLE